MIKNKSPFSYDERRWFANRRRRPHGMGQNSSAHVARVVGLQTDAVVVTETRLSNHLQMPQNTKRAFLGPKWLYS